MTEPRPRNLLLLLPAALALLLAMWTGLIRVGWQLPSITPGLHAPLMVSGFLGTLICLERTVAVIASFQWRKGLYVMPLLAALGTILLIAGVAGSLGAIFITLASFFMTGVFLVTVREQPELYSVTMGLGAASWLGGNILWLLGQPFFVLAYWWIGFLVLTIAGERLELSRIMRHSQFSLQLFGGIVLLFLLGQVGTLIQLEVGIRLIGLAGILLAVWLLRYDIARRTIKQEGITRFIAACLLPGYFWLGIGGGLALFYGNIPAGPVYGAILHSILLGFVFSMIFGHAPIIFPSVTGLDIPYYRMFYVHLLLLHMSLILRIIGDLIPELTWRQWGSMINVIAILLFLGTTAFAAVRGRRVQTVDVAAKPAV